MKTRKFNAILLSIVAIAFIMRIGAEPGLQSVTRVDDLEILGTTIASENVLAEQGLQLTDSSGPTITSGVGDPEGSITAGSGSLLVRTDATQLYQNLNGSTDWESVITNAVPFDNGDDGTVVFDGVSVVLGFSPVGGVYTLTREIYPANMTVETGVTVLTACGIYVVGELVLNGTALIHNNGNSGTGATGGTASLSCSGGGVAGTGGGAGGGAGAAGSNATDPGQSSPGGRGITPSGTSNGGAAGVAGTAGAVTRGGGGGGGATGNAGGRGGTISVGAMGRISLLVTQRQNNASSQFAAGTGGGGGGGGLSGTGGGGGSGGGWLVVAARVLRGAGTIQSAGGAGADGTGTGGGGGGGGGGIVVVLYGTRIGTTAITAPGGAGGGVTGTGAAGGAGGAGVTVIKQFN